jgi:hypothetical protein
MIDDMFLRDLGKTELPREWIDQLGGNASYVLAWICERTSAENYWMAWPLRGLQGFFPWLKKSALHEILQKLVKERFLVKGRGIKGAGKSLGYGVPGAIRQAWDEKRDAVQFCLKEASKSKGVGNAIVLYAMCDNFESKTKINFHAIARKTGVKVPTVSNIFWRFKRDYPELWLEALQERNLLTDVKPKPVWVVGRGLRSVDAQGQVKYTREEQVVALSV